MTFSGRKLLLAKLWYCRVCGLCLLVLLFRNSVPANCQVVGASYIALECAGFLHELGFDVSIAVRSVLLRGFDQQVRDLGPFHFVF
jgi:hypothetical protein